VPERWQCICSFSVGSYLAPTLQILEIFQVIGARSPTTATRWPTTVGRVSSISWQTFMPLNEGRSPRM